MSTTESTPAQPNQVTGITLSVPKSTGLEALYEARDRELVSCVGTQPLSSQMPLSAISFECPQLGVTATLTEMRDAGWRLESIDVGQEATLEGVITMPLKISIRKLF